MHEQRITTVSRHTSGTAVGLSCGHSVLRHPNWSIPADMQTECEECAADAAAANHPRLG